MIITETGKYRLTKNWGSRGTCSIVQFEKGAVIEITQVDPVNRKVLGPSLLDWAGWNLPFEPVNKT